MPRTDPPRSKAATESVEYRPKASRRETNAPLGASEDFVLPSYGGNAGRNRPGRLKRVGCHILPR